MSNLSHAVCQVEALNKVSFVLPAMASFEQLGNESDLVDSSDEEKATTSSLKRLMQATGMKAESKKTARKPAGLRPQRQGRKGPDH